MILDAIGNFGNGSGSQIIGRIRNLGCCTWGSRPDLFSLDLIWLILKLSSPNSACSRPAGQQANEKEKLACQRDSWAGAGLRRSNWPACGHCGDGLSVYLIFFNQMLLKRLSHRIETICLRILKNVMLLLFLILHSWLSLNQSVIYTMYIIVTNQVICYRWKGPSDFRAQRARRHLEPWVTAI